MRSIAPAVAALLAATLAFASARHPALVADLPDDVLAAVNDRGSDRPAAILDAVLAHEKGFLFRAAGLTARSDRRWYAGASVSGPGAPILELRRWPGDTVLSFYELDGGASAAPVGGLDLDGKTTVAGGWSIREGRLATPKGTRPAVWGEIRVGERRVGALGVPGDGGFGPAAVPDLVAAIVAVIGRTTLDGAGGPASSSATSPELPAPPAQADERHDGWQSFAGPGFTLGLPPGVRAASLDSGVGPARPMPYAVAWLRGRFVDRDGAAVVVGDERHAGYVALLDPPDETWRAGVAPPLGSPAADKRDEASLDELVREGTGASRAAVSHWKEEGFEGDWLVFRLLVEGRGIEIGLPVVSSWRSLALFWIPTTWRPAGRPPAPPPIDPAASLGVRFDRLIGEDRRRLPLTEGFLTVGDLRVEVPKGLWPIANLASSDGLPLTFVDPAGETVGRLARLAAGSREPAIAGETGWSAVAHPGSQRASQIWRRDSGAAILVAKDGHGYVFEPLAKDAAAPNGPWARLWQGASFTKAPRR